MPVISQRENEAGVALLMVMFGLIVIGVLALGLVLATRSGVREAHSSLEASERRAFFDAVMLQSGVSLLDTSQNNRPRIDGVTQLTNVLGQNVLVTITSEFGKVDLNAADADTLSNLFEAAGEGPAEAAEEAHQVAIWRRGGSGTANIRLFRIVAELIHVPDISQDLYNRIAPAITVYSGRERVDQDTAPLLALEAMSGMDHLAAESILQNRANNQTSNQVGEVVNGQLSPGIVITGWAFQIEASFTLNSRPEHARCVIRMTGDPTHPYLVLWREETPE